MRAVGGTPVVVKSQKCLHFRGPVLKKPDVLEHFWKEKKCFFINMLGKVSLGCVSLG